MDPTLSSIGKIFFRLF